MRVLMEMGGNIRCGKRGQNRRNYNSYLRNPKPLKRPETHIIPRMLARWEQGSNTPRMNDSGVSKDLYDEICSEFLLKIIGSGSSLLL